MQAADGTGDARQRELVGELAGLVSHDLANRLAVARLTAEVLGNRADLPDDLAARVATVVEATTDAAEIVQQLSAVAGRRPAPAHRVDVGRVLQELIPLLRAALGRRCLLDVAARSAVVVADRRDIEELLLRLLLGGGSPRPTDVAVDVRTDADEVVVVVRRLVDDDLSERSLTWVSALTRTSGGTFLAETDDSNRILTVRLPAAAAPDSSRDRRAAQTVTILVVEDDADLRQLVRSALEAEGHRVDAVGDADAAFAHPAVLGGDVGLLLTDVELPGASGLDLAAKLAAEGVPVVVMSGHGEADLGDDLPEGVLVLDKPFGVLELRAVTQRALEGR